MIDLVLILIRFGLLSRAQAESNEAVLLMVKNRKTWISETVVYVTLSSELHSDGVKIESSPGPQ